MKKISIILITTLLTATGKAQTHDITGAWYWEDSTNTNSISLFFEPEGLIKQITSNGNGATLNENKRNGKYILKGNVLLVITWDDKAIENKKIKFFNDNEIRITYSTNKNSKDVRIFKRVVDEELKPDN